jgi:hypothetical protein
LVLMRLSWDLMFATRKPRVDRRESGRATAHASSGATS